jgi:hypothetical protein
MDRVGAAFGGLGDAVGSAVGGVGTALGGLLGSTTSHVGSALGALGPLALLIGLAAVLLGWVMLRR